MDLEAFSEFSLRRELERRAKLSADGNCTYCAKPLGSHPPCRFADRHGYTEAQGINDKTIELMLIGIDDVVKKHRIEKPGVPHGAGNDAIMKDMIIACRRFIAKLKTERTLGIVVPQPLVELHSQDQGKRDMAGAIYDALYADDLDMAGKLDKIESIVLSNTKQKDPELSTGKPEGKSGSSGDPHFEGNRD